MNPPIVRAIVSDRDGDILFDSDAPRYWRPGPARQPIVRRYAPPPAPVADLSEPAKFVGYLLIGCAGTLLVACVLICAAITIGWWP